MEPEIVDLTKDDESPSPPLITSSIPPVIITIPTSPQVITIHTSPPTKRRKLHSTNRPRTPKPSVAPPQPVPLEPPHECYTLKCPICLETFFNVKKNSRKVCATRCGHMFCDDCLKKSMNESGRKCPKCRKLIPKGAYGIIEIFDIA